MAYSIFSRSALRHYQELALSSRLEAATPHALVSLLYEELIITLDVLKAATTNRPSPSPKPGSSAARASSILVSLEASLDFEQGGQLAQTLAGIYRTMQAELTFVIRHQDQARLAVLREGVTDLYQAWRQI